MGHAYPGVAVVLVDLAYRVAVVDPGDHPFQAGEGDLADLLVVVGDLEDQEVEEAQATQHLVGVEVQAEHLADHQVEVEEVVDHQEDPFLAVVVVAAGHLGLHQAVVEEVGDHRDQADQDELSLLRFSTLLFLSSNLQFQLQLRLFLSHNPPSIATTRLPYPPTLLLRPTGPTCLEHLSANFVYFS